MPHAPFNTRPLAPDTAHPVMRRAAALAMQSRKSAAGSTKRPPFDADSVVTFLRRSFPTATALNVHAESGIPAATVDNWLRGRAAPSAAHMGLLIDRFGPAILSAAYPGTERWLGGQVRRERIEKALAELEAALL